jgi:hypothetical protein
VVDRVVPIDGVPLLPGRLRLVVDGGRLNGGGEAALLRVAEVVGGATAEQTGSPGAVAATRPLKSAPADGQAPAFPVEMVIDTGRDYVLLSLERAMRVPLDPGLVGDLSMVLGEGCVRVVGGVAVEVPAGKDHSPWGGAAPEAQRGETGGAGRGDAGSDSCTGRAGQRRRRGMPGGPAGRASPATVRRERRRELDVGPDLALMVERCGGEPAERRAGDLGRGGELKSGRCRSADAAGRGSQRVVAGQVDRRGWAVGRCLRHQR